MSARRKSLMQALVYYHSPARYLACKFLSRMARRRFFPKIAPLHLNEVPVPKAEGPWVLLKNRMCGICGSDLNLLRGQESFLLEPYASFPAVLGHEILAEVAEAAPDTGFTPGQRVVVEPILSCAQRGLPPCRSCARGDYNLCENFIRGELTPGMVLGYNQSVGGGMAPMMRAHATRLLAVPDSMSDETAVLTDSVASALQPCLDNFPPDNAKVVIYGAGVIAQHLLRCLRALGCGSEIFMVSRHPFQSLLATRGGANHVLRSPGRKELADALDASLLPTTLGGGNIEGGADYFFDCVGGSHSLQEGLLALRARGVYVMVGTAASIKNADVSSLWARQLTMTGTAMYGKAIFRGQPVRTYELALSLLESGNYDTQGLLTHTFALQDWEKAFETVFNKKANQSVKVAFDHRTSAK